MEAQITLKYSDEKTARVVASAISPDNFKVPDGLSVVTETDKRGVVTSIACERKMETFIATIDDLLFSVSTAEKTIQAMRKLEKG